MLRYYEITHELGLSFSIAFGTTRIHISFSVSLLFLFFVLGITAGPGRYNTGRFVQHNITRDGSFDAE